MSDNSAVVSYHTTSSSSSSSSNGEWNFPRPFLSSACYPPNQYALPPPPRPASASNSSSVNPLFAKARSSASFDWWALRIFLYPRLLYTDALEKHLISNFLPLFPDNVQGDHLHSLEIEREIAAKKARFFAQADFVNDGAFTENPSMFYQFIADRGICNLNADYQSAIAVGLHIVFCTTLEKLSSADRHGQLFFNKIKNPSQSPSPVHTLEYFGCMAITEFSHGTNTRNLRTTASYDKTRKQFCIHTPDRESAKVWIGNLGKTATHAAVAAQLIIDGKNLGLHFFVVPIRDTKTHLTFAGVKVGDVGWKDSWNGVDHGHMAFEHYYVDRTALCNRFADVDEAGNYVLKVKDNRKRFGLTLSVLSSGRLAILRAAVVHMRNAMTVAIRYSFARRQFGSPSQSIEVPVIQYPLQRWRLFPYLAASYCFSFLTAFLSQQYFTSLDDISAGENVSESFLAFAAEFHAISCGAKALSTWLARDAIVAAREACGGHGFLASARINKWKMEADPATTYEGTNSVMMQQTAKFLFDALRRMYKAQNSPSKKSKLPIDDRFSPMQSVFFLNDFLEISSSSASFSSVDDLVSSNVASVLQNHLLPALKWRVVYLLSESAQTLMPFASKKLNTRAEKLAVADDLFARWNDLQPTTLLDASKAFLHVVVAQKTLDAIVCAPSEPLKAVLRLLLKTFILWTICGGEAGDGLAHYLEGGYFQKSHSLAVKEALKKCHDDLLPEAMALVDAVSIPDELLRSTLGRSDGNIYDNVWAKMDEDKQSYERPKHWQLLRTPLQPKSAITAKL